MFVASLAELLKIILSINVSKGSKPFLKNICGVEYTYQ